MSAEEFVAAYRKKYPGHKVPEPRAPQPKKKLFRRALLSLLFIPILVPLWILVMIGYGSAVLSEQLVKIINPDPKERAK